MLYKSLQLKGKIRESKINYFTKKKNERYFNRNGPKIDGISNSIRILIILLEPEIHFQGRFQKLNLLTNWSFLLIEQYIFGTNCLIRSKTAIVYKI